MKLALEGKKALIIGAGHGIGLELANMLLDERAEVCAVARRVESLSVFSEKNGLLLTFAADLVPEGAEFSLLRFLEKNVFEPDILVHCMGGRPCITADAPAHKIWRAWYRILFELPLIFDEAFLPCMREKGRSFSCSTLFSFAGLESGTPLF